MTTADQRIEETPNPSWGLLERVAASTQLKPATRLQDLLLYMRERSMEECSRKDVPITKASLQLMLRII